MTDIREKSCFSRATSSGCKTVTDRRPTWRRCFVRTFLREISRSIVRREMPVNETASAFVIHPIPSSSFIHNLFLRHIPSTTGGLWRTCTGKAKLRQSATVRPVRSVAGNLNHPSGDTVPSQEDLHITRRIREVCEVLGVRVLDHVILGEGTKYVSFVDDAYWEK